MRTRWRTPGSACVFTALAALAPPDDPPPEPSRHARTPRPRLSGDELERLLARSEASSTPGSSTGHNRAH
jgi:hypothetical protein